MNRVLVCISNAELFLFLRHVLANEGYRAIAALERRDIFDQHDLKQFRVIVFKWDARAATKKSIDFSKSTVPDVPLIILSRKDQVPPDLVRQNDLLLTRPFDPSTLVDFLRRLRHDHTACRRNALTPSIIRYSGIELNVQTMEAKRDGHRLALTSLQFRLLDHLMVRGPQICDRDELIARCWPTELDVEPRTVDIHIGHLRKALMRHGPDIIRTVRGKGYALKTPPE